MRKVPLIAPGVIAFVALVSTTFIDDAPLRELVRGVGFALVASLVLSMRPLVGRSHFRRAVPVLAGLVFSGMAVMEFTVLAHTLTH
jgi:hypothetical protein